MFNSFSVSESSTIPSIEQGSGVSQKYNAEFLKVLESSGLDQLKKKCFPASPRFPLSEGNISNHLFISIPFPKHMIGSESYAENTLYSNIILDGDGELYELLFEYDEEYMNQPTNGSRLIRATEYRDKFGVLSARKFDGYVI